MAVCCRKPTPFNRPLRPRIVRRQIRARFLQAVRSSDPDTHYYLACSEIPPHGFSMQRFCDPFIDAAQAAGAQSYDRTTRQRQAALVQRRLATVVPFVALYQTNAFDVIPATLHGFKRSSLSPYWNVAHWTLDMKSR